MQLRSNTGVTSDRPLDVTDKDYLEEAICGLQSIVSEQFASMGLMEIEVSNTNIEQITEMLPPFHAFLLGRLTTLMDLHKELYGENRLLSWVKKPELN
tara:strand:- start:282 stop:575 length:294 start_codon:yes stop_codon:yes gene_type:complete